jgi:tellurite methyltransferase
MTKTPFWEASYGRPGKLDTFGGGKPSKSVVEAASLVSNRLGVGASALDLGCGEGRNSIYLASLGFNTYATDISDAGINKLTFVAQERNLIINASVCDMREYGFPQQFDLIVCQGCLHLIERDEWRLVLKRIQDCTISGGLNVVAVFADTVPEPEDQKGLMVGLFKEGELFEHYRDWNIIESDSFQFADEHPGELDINMLQTGSRLRSHDKPKIRYRAA